MGLNKCMIIGNLGNDPELKYTQSGKAVANFNVAVSEKYKGKENTEWFKIVVWDKLAEICGEYLKKGSQVYLEGKIQTRSWEDRDGNKRYTTELVAFQMQMLSGREMSRGQDYDNSGKEESQGQSGQGNEPEDMDVPF